MIAENKWQENLLLTECTQILHPEHLHILFSKFKIIFFPIKTVEQSEMNVMETTITILIIYCLYLQMSCISIGLGLTDITLN